MLLSKTVKVKIIGSNMKWYEEKGYTIPKFKNKKGNMVIQNNTFIEVKIEDLPTYSNVIEVKVKCDYCGKEFTKTWSKFKRGREYIEKDVCSECIPQKQKEICLLKNGVEHYTQLEEERIKLRERKTIHTIEEVYKLFKEAGYELVTKEYINNEQHLQYICPKHGLKEISLGHFLDGKRCAECFYENNSRENNNRWNGGITETNHYLRGLLNKWKKESFEKYDYKCCITGKTGYLEIHHAYPFKNIVEDVFNELAIKMQPQICDYKKEDLQLIEKLFLQKHKEKLGYPLLKEIHEEFHSIYGTYNATESDFYEFMKNMKVSL